MADPTPADKTDSSIPRETYSMGYGPAFQNGLMGRSFQRYGGFLLPHLRPGMRVLDCGCGPGAITLGLAEAVAPGEVVGIDIAESEVAAARALAASLGVTNVRFEVGNVYELPFPDDSFDATFVNALLVQLREPVRALQEIRRVLKPGGVVGVGEPDFSMCILEPSTPILEKYKVLFMQITAYNGGDFSRGRHLRRLLLEAGFARTEGSAFASCDGTLEATRNRSEIHAVRLQEEQFGGIAIRNGWADVAELEAMAAALRAWGERPDAFLLNPVCQALGWVPETE